MNFRDGKKSSLKYQNTRVFTLLKRKPRLAGCWLTFHKFPWQLSLFFPKKSSFHRGMIFSHDCILLAVSSSLTINHVEAKRGHVGLNCGLICTVHMHSDPPQCLLPKEGQNGSGEEEVLQEG